MKLWLKYLIGIVLGVAAAFILPLTSIQGQAFIDAAVEIVLRFCRYGLLPVMFFSIATSFFKLRDERLMTRTALWTGGVILASSFALTLIGLLSALIVKLPRIPITVEKVSEVQTLNLRTLIASIFPYSGFGALVDGAFLLPCFIFAGLAGAGAASDKVSSKQAVTLFDSLSKVCYIVMSFITEIFTVGMIAISAKWTLDFIAIIKTGIFLPLILMLLVDLILIGVVIYPLVLHFLCHDLHPFHYLYASLCPFLVAFFSGDTNAALTLALRHGKESLGIRRRINSTVMPLFSIFARGGAALVTSVCFVVILRSYTPLGVTVLDALWIGATSFVISFALGALPQGGPFIAITMLCMMYGRGFEAGYLLLKAASPIICAFACGIDVLTQIWGTYIVGVKTKNIVHKDVKQYI